MIGDGFNNLARGFDRVYANATAGGNDRACLYDSASNDFFEATGNRATLSFDESSVSASGFSWVEAIAGKGGDDTKCVRAVDFVLEMQEADWADASGV